MYDLSDLSANLFCISIIQGMRSLHSLGLWHDPVTCCLLLLPAEQKTVMYGMLLPSVWLWGLKTAAGFPSTLGIVPWPLCHQSANMTGKPSGLLCIHILVANVAVSERLFFFKFCLLDNYLIIVFALDLEGNAKWKISLYRVTPKNMWVHYGKTIIGIKYVLPHIEIRYGPYQHVHYDSTGPNGY